MSRPLRIDVVDGWYHVMSRGIDRRTIFSGATYYRHFIELLEAMCARYNVEVHAYCLMPNHYHLVIRTPEANASMALQWLNVSYASWFNAKQQRAGHVFQGRFKSVLIDGEGSWVRLAADYVHLNPVRTGALGAGKGDVGAERHGYKIPSDEVVQRRLERLRKYKWSSYPAYAGYESCPKWLHSGIILEQAGGVDKYRRSLQEYVTAGAPPEDFESLRDRVAIGSARFVESVKRRIVKVSPEQPAGGAMRRLVPFELIVSLVEKEMGRQWDDFRDSHGDYGRDLVLYLARMKSGLTLAEIGLRAGGIEYKAVGKAVQRFTQRMAKDRILAGKVGKCMEKLSNVETRPQ